MTGPIHIDLRKQTSRLPRMSMTPVWATMPILLLLAVVWTNTDFPADFWMHANLGRAMWHEHAWIQADTFTHTIAGHPVVNQAWLAQLFIFSLVSTGGYALAQFVAGLIYAGGLAMVGYATYRRCGNVRLATALTFVSIAAAAGNLAVRPQMFSVLFFGALLVLLWTGPPRWTTVLGTALIQLLWTNTHGAFPLGVVLPGIFLVGRASDVARRDGPVAVAYDQRVRCLLACCIAAAGAVFINPNGTAVLGYVTGVTSLASSRGIEEWLPPTLDTAPGIALFASLAVVLAVLGMSRKTTSVLDTLLLVAMLVLAAKSQRMVIWWAMVVAPILAPHAAALLEDRRTQIKKSDPRTVDNTVVLGLVLLFVAFTTPWTRAHNPLLPAHKRLQMPRDTPNGALVFLQQRHYRGRLYQPMEWGALMSWRLDPAAKVFVDSRIDFFPDQVWNDYVRIGTHPEFADELLARYSVDTVVWDRRRDKGLLPTLAQSRRWTRIYQDDLAVVYQKAGTPKPKPGERATESGSGSRPAE